MALIPQRQPVGGISGEVSPDEKLDVIVAERGGYSVYSETTPRKRLGGPYPSRAVAKRRLAQVEYFKKHADVAGPMVPVRFDARRARLPRQIPPTRHEEDYAAALLRIVGRVKAAWAPLVRAAPDIISGAQLERGDRHDSSSKKLRRIIDSCAQAAQAAVRQDELEGLARKVAGRVGAYQKDQLGRQVRAALGVDPVFRDPGMAGRVEQFAHHNAALVKSIPEHLHQDLEVLVTQAVAGGHRAAAGGAGSLQKKIEKRFGVAESRARLIARDQVTKFYAAVNHHRQKQLGIKKFIWRTVGDERVRGDPSGRYPNAEPSHYDLGDRIFKYSDPPQPEGADDPILPGEDYQCRCWADPVFDGEDEDEETE